MAIRFRRQFVLAPFAMLMLMLEACGGTAPSEGGTDPSGAPIQAPAVPSGTATGSAPGAETPATASPADPSAATAVPQTDVPALPDGSVMQVPSACDSREPMSSSSRNLWIVLNPTSIRRMTLGFS